MIIRKQIKNDSVLVGIWFSNQNARLDNGKKSSVYRIPLSDIKNAAALKNDLEKFLKNYVKEN